MKIYYIRIPDRKRETYIPACEILKAMFHTTSTSFRRLDSEEFLPRGARYSDWVCYTDGKYIWWGYSLTYLKEIRPRAEFIEVTSDRYLIGELK